MYNIVFHCSYHKVVVLEFLCQVLTRYALLLLNGKSKCYCLSLIASHTIQSDCCLPYSYQHSLLCLVNLHKIKQAAVSSTGLCAVCFQIYIYKPTFLNHLFQKKILYCALTQLVFTLPR